MLEQYADGEEMSIGQRASPGGPGAWKNARTGSRVELELLPSAWEVGYRRNNTPTPVVRLKVAQEAWLSWYERWQVEEAKKRLRLDTVSLGFWQGPAGSIHQLFRAEWEHCGIQEASGTAQPHWNIDHPVPVLLPSGQEPLGKALSPGNGLEELPPEGGGLIEEPSSSTGWGSSLLDISQYHLSMGATWSPPENRAWRRPYGENVSSLLAWIELCLEHVSLELRSHAVNSAHRASRLR